MPDGTVVPMRSDPRDPHAAERLAERQRAYREAMQELDADATAHLTVQARDNCSLCDADGYTPAGVVCDHVDRAATAKRGIALVRQALTKGKPA